MTPAGVAHRTTAVTKASRVLTPPPSLRVNEYRVRTPHPPPLRHGAKTVLPLLLFCGDAVLSVAREIADNRQIVMNTKSPQVIMDTMQAPGATKWLSRARPPPKSCAGKYCPFKLCQCILLKSNVDGKGGSLSTARNSLFRAWLFFC